MALLTDTVGFIQKLPTQLVAAFRATLEELTDADLLLHVVDITHPNADEQFETVEATLRDLELDDKPRIIAFNKVDLVAGAEEGQPKALRDLETAVAADHPEALLISAARKWGLDTLRSRIEAKIADTRSREAVTA